MFPYNAKQSFCLTQLKIFTRLTFLPTQTGKPIMIAGTATPATRLIPIGAPANIPNCHKTFFLRLQGFLPQNVHPEGLKYSKH